MHNPYLILSFFLMSYIIFFICYQLALSFIGVSLPVKRILLPILIFSVIAYISKISLNTSASVHTIVVVITCTGLLYLMNKISIILSFIGSLLSFTTLTIGSMLFACPLFIKLGYTIPLKYSGFAWILLNLLELVVPTLVLIIFKKANFSFMKYVNTAR